MLSIPSAPDRDSSAHAPGPVLDARAPLAGFRPCEMHHPKVGRFVAAELTRLCGIQCRHPQVPEVAPYRGSLRQLAKDSPLMAASIAALASNQAVNSSAPQPGACGLLTERPGCDVRQKRQLFLPTNFVDESVRFLVLKVSPPIA